MESYLDFELPIAGLEKKLSDLLELSKQENVDLSAEIKMLERKRDALIDEVFSKLTRWQRVQLSRHPNRPYTQDYVHEIFPDFMELHGDRRFADDQAIIGGTATLNGNPLMIIGHQKGRTTKQKIERNFGMAKPEGYRKAMRLMKLAERSKMPILTLIDTPGAYPGIGAEERGQSQAIAECIETLFELDTPVLACVISEGGSGGALALGVADRVLMLENSIYSVISPESCASILWSDSTLAERASERLKLTAKELKQAEIIDRIIIEPKGGAHRNWLETCDLLKKTFIEELDHLSKSKTKSLSQLRIEKFRKMGNFAIARAKLHEKEKWDH